MKFDEIYAQYADSVYSFLRYKIRDVHLVEDIFQDTFLTAYRELSNGRLPERPKAWLLTIAHRRMVDRLRREPVSETALEETIEADRRDNPQSTDSLFIEEMMNRLDEASRTILYSLYVEGLSVKETAVLLGIPEGTVKSRGFAARTKLSQWMWEEDSVGT